MSDSPTEPSPGGEEKKDKPNLPPIPEEVREASLRKESPSKADETETASKAESEQQSARANEPPHCEYTIIGSDGEEYGPVTTEKVNHWITTGQANGQTLPSPTRTVLVANLTIGFFKQGVIVVLA